MKEKNRCKEKKDAEIKEKRKIEITGVKIDKMKKKYKRNRWNPVLVERIKGQVVLHIDKRALNEFLGILLTDILCFDNKQLKHLLNLVLVGIAGKKKGKMPSVDECDIIHYVTEKIFEDAQKCFNIPTFK